MSSKLKKELVDIPWAKGDPEHLFRKDAVLDEGSFGVVWKGKVVGSNEDVAIKVMELKPESLDEIKSEINFLKLFESPFIIHYYGTWLDKGKETIWIVLELAELGSLEGILIFCDYKFTEAQLGAIMARTLLGISYVHGKGLVHQDIKAKNILLTLRGEVKLADFGVASKVTNVNDTRGTVSGSPHWMAPEILEGREITQKCDIWSLGITLIELIENQPPHAEIPPIDVIIVIPTVPAPRLDSKKKWSRELRSFLKRMCEKDPLNRRDADRLMKHPFVKEQVIKARNGNHDLLYGLAEECYDVVQSYRADIAEDDEGDFSLDLYGSVSEYDESSDDEEALIIKGRHQKLKKKSAKSFISVEVDQNVLEKEFAEEREKLKSRLIRRNKTRKTKAGSSSRLTRGHERNHSVMSLTYRHRKSYLPGNAKASMMLQVKQKLQFNLTDVKTERFRNKQTRLQGNLSPREGQDRDDKIKKAEVLLSKLQQLTNRKL